MIESFRGATNGGATPLPNKETKAWCGKTTNIFSKVKNETWAPLLFGMFVKILSQGKRKK